MNERIAIALERIAVALEAWSATPEQIAVPCHHPDDERIDRSTMGRPRWTCKLCGFSVGMEGEG